MKETTLIFVLLENVKKCNLQSQQSKCKISFA